MKDTIPTGFDPPPFFPNLSQAKPRSRAKLREAAAALIEALVGIVDEIEGDPDLEPDADAEDGGDDEASLSLMDNVPDGEEAEWRPGSPSDLEEGED